MAAKLRCDISLAGYYKGWSKENRTGREQGGGGLQLGRGVTRENADEVKSENDNRYSGKYSRTVHITAVTSLNRCLERTTSHPSHARRSSDASRESSLIEGVAQSPGHGHVLSLPFCPLR